MMLAGKESAVILTEYSMSDDTYSEEEPVARREAALRRMLATPHKPHKQQKRKSQRED